MKNIADLLGRMLLAFIFFYEAYDSIFFKDANIELMAHHGVTWQPELLLYGSITILILGGIMVLTGYRAGLGVILLLLYWIPVTFIAHDFWNVPQNCGYKIECEGLAAEAMGYHRLQGILFMKNLAIIGGLLILWVNGSGKFSIRRLFATTKVPGV